MQPKSERVTPLYVKKADGPVTRVHHAFQAPDPETVVAFHQAALGAGGHDNGARELNRLGATNGGSMNADEQAIRNVIAQWHRATAAGSGGNANVRSGSALSILRKQANGAWVLERDANLLAAA